MNRSLPAMLWAFLAAAGGLAAPMDARDWHSLIGTSPFGAEVMPASAPADAGWEFRGVVREGDELLFCLYNSADGSSRWVRLKEEAAGVRPEDYDHEAERIVLTVDNRVLSLGLKRAKVILSAPVLPSDPNDPGFTEQKSSEQMVLDAAIEREVRRRRAEHESDMY